MAIKQIDTSFNILVDKISNIHETIQQDVIKSVSSGLTLRNWIIGYYIVEYEQNGKDRAGYGDKIIENLVLNLKHIKGMSLSNIKSFRQFYLTYPQISQSVSGFLKIENEISDTNDNPPIGLILCANKNHTKVEYATAGLDNNLFVSKYKINLPSIKEIEDFIEDELENFGEKI